MKPSLLLAGAAAAALLAATAAQAGSVHWSVGIDLPPVATYVSNGPAYYPAAVGYAPRRVYVPRPVYVERSYAPGSYAPVYDVPRYTSEYVPEYAPRYSSTYSSTYLPTYLPTYEPRVVYREARRPHPWLPPLPPLPALPPLPWSGHHDR